MANPSPSPSTPTSGSYLPVVEICFVSITFVFLLIRLVGRGFILRSPGLDDLFVGLAFLFAVAFTVSHILATKWGWGHHVSDLDLSDARKMLSAEWTQNWTWLLAESFTKLSILTFYLHFATAEHAVFRYLTYGVIVFVALYGTALAFVDIFACNPVSSFWNISSLKDTDIYRSKGCIGASSYRNVLYAQSALDLASDTIVVLLPVRTMWRMRTGPGQRVTMGILLFLGFLVIISAMVRFRVLVDFLTKPDHTWNGYEMFLWLAIKLYLSIVCACLLFVRPVFAALSRPLSDCYHYIRSSASSSASSNPNEKEKKEEQRSSATFAGFQADAETSNRNSALKEPERVETPNILQRPEPKSIAIDLEDEHYGTHSPYFGEKRYSIRDSREMRPDMVPLPLSPSQLSIDVLPPPSPSTPKGLSPPPPLKSPSVRSGTQSATSSNERQRDSQGEKERAASQDTTAGTIFTSEPPSRMSFRSSFIGVTVNTGNGADAYDRRMSTLSRRRSSEALPENDPGRVQSSAQMYNTINTSSSSNTNSPVDGPRGASFSYTSSPVDRGSSFSYTNSPVERLSISHRGSTGGSPIDRSSLGTFAFERGSIGGGPGGRNSSLRGSGYQPSVSKRRSSDALPEGERSTSIVGSARDLREGVYSARGSMYQPTLSTRRSSDALPESERAGGPAGRDGLYSARGSIYQPTLSTRRSSEALPENDRNNGGGNGLREGLYSARGSVYVSLSPRRSSEALPENDRTGATAAGAGSLPSRENSRYSGRGSLALRRSSDALPAGEGPRAPPPR